MKVTVKTMDSGSEVFELPDETTVKGLRDMILSKMGISLDQQRIIFQGKVLKDEELLQNYGVDGKVIHLVKRPPPSLAGEPAGGGQGAASSATPPTEGGESGRGITVHASQDMVFVGNIPVSSRNDITQVTQNIVDQIVSSLSSHGAEAQVSAEAVTTDLSGATHTTTVSGQTGQRAEANATPPPPPPPPHASDASRRVPTHPTAPPPGVPSGAQQRKEPEKEEGGGSGGGGSGVGVPVESERRKRHLKNVYIHSRSVRRCLQHATRVLDRYDRSMVRVKRRREREREGEEEGEEEEKWDAVESMEVLEGGRGDGGGDEDLPSEERYPELNQPQDTAQLSASLFVRFFDEVEALQRRVRPCVLEYRRRMDEDQVINEDEVMDANRIAITVKDFNYYIGHAHVSLSRLHVSMAAPPPRTLRLTAPRRTEMRRMMQQFRPRPPGLGGPPGRDGPSGYIVDISRDDEAGGQGSERRSTRAVVNRGGGGGGRGGPPGFGGGGGPPGFGGGGGPPGFGGGFPGFGGLFGSMGMMGSRRGGGEGTGGGDKEGSGAEKEPAKAEGSTSGSGGAEGGTKMEMDEGRAEGGTKMEMDEGRALFREEEVRSKNEEKNTKQEVDEKVKSKFKVEVKDDEEGKRKFKVEVKDNEEGKSKFKVEVKVDEEVKSKGSQEKEEVNEEGKKETEDGKDSGDETPQYLARLLSELITGVADPAGPYRPTNKSKEGEEKTGGDGAVGGASNEGVAPDKDVSSTTTKPSESSGSSGGKEGEEGGEGGEGRRRTFAERYAGPEGTTVTISAAPVPPFGIPGLPPMEGPSVSIKNRGDGVEPEMTINFPMPPAIQLLQGLLERAEERHRQRREAGETSSEEEEESEEEESEEETEEEKRKREEKRKELAKNRPEKAFLDEDGEIDSLSDPGSLDSIHSDDREDAPEFENQPPTSAPPISAPPTVPPSGERLTMLDAMEQVKSQLAPNERTINRNLGMMEEALKVISRELSVVEVMQVFKGEVGPASRLQPCLLKFVQDRLLDGKEPTRERRDGAVGVFLTGCKPALVEAECELPLRDVGLDFPATLHLLLSQICCEAYDHITANYSKKEAEGNGFGCSMRHWARHSSGLFSNVVRHCVDGEKQFEEIIEKLIGTLFPPNAPSMILDMCSGSILRELMHVRGDHPYGPQELDSYLCWKEGVLPTPNTSYDLAAYSLDQSTLHQGQMLPIPARESCPGGPGAGAEKEGNGRGSIGFPHGVPEEWVPSIKRDRASSSSSTLAGPQQPYSSAYLSGMPAKRRKQLDTSEPLSRSPQDLSFQLMEEALLETGASTVTGKSQLEMLSLLHHDDALAEAVARDVYNIQRDRCASSPSFEAERYPSCAQYYKISPPKDTLP